MPLCVRARTICLQLIFIMENLILESQANILIISYKINNQLIKRKKKKKIDSQSCKNPTVKDHGQLELQLSSGQGVN